MTATITFTASATATETATATFTATDTATETATATFTATATPTETASYTSTDTPTETATSTVTDTSSATPYLSPTPTSTVTLTAVACRVLLPEGPVSPFNGSRPGDLVVTLSSHAVLLGLHTEGPDTGTWYLYASPQSSRQALPGACLSAVPDPQDPSHLLVALYAQRKIGVVDANGDYVGDFASLPGQPIHIAVGPDGAAYAAQYNTGIWRVPRNGTASLLPGAPIKCINLAFDAAGALWVTLDGGAVVKSDGPPSLSSNSFVGGVAPKGGQPSGIVTQPSGTYYFNTRQNTAAAAKGAILSFPAVFSGPFAPVQVLADERAGLAALEGLAMDSGGALWAVQLNGLPVDHGSEGVFSKGVARLDPASGEMHWFPLPASLGGLDLSAAVPSGAAILGQVLPRPACGLPATGFSLPTPGSTQTPAGATAAGLKQTPIPSVGLLQLDQPLLVAPNPARDLAQAYLQVDEPARGTLRLYGLDGTLVFVQDLGSLTAGVHSVPLDLGGQASGTYLLVLQLQGASGSLRRETFKLAVLHQKKGPLPKERPWVLRQAVGG